MPITRCRQAETVIGLRIFAIANAKEGQLQEADDRRQHVFARQAVMAQIGVHVRPDARERPAEHQHSVELGFISRLAPALMVAVLLASPRIAAGFA